MEISSLRIPRVEVYWGPVNLTSPSKTPEFFSQVKGSNGTIPIDSESLGPLVYDVRVGMEDQGQTPTGSLKWNPSGVGFQLYEKCLKEYIDYSIIVNFYYVSGGYIPFEFYWGGQGDTYGKEMELTVKLVSLMDGLVNANMYATVQADREERGKSHQGAVSEIEKKFGIKDFNLIRYTKKANKDTNKSIVKMNYNEGSTFMDAVQNLVKDNGNFVFFNNIGASNAVVYGPYTWEGKEADSAPIDAQTRYSSATPVIPDPTVRYIYAIAPGIIQSFTRTYEWQPPQKSQEISSMLGRKPQPPQSSRNPATQTLPSQQQQTSQTAATAPQGVHSNPTTPNIRSEKNEDGPKKQDLFTKEKAAKLSLTTFMCPALLGIKPLDIILIRSYGSDWVEDWVVNSVEYQQGQGGVDVSIQASRSFGLGEPMVKAPIDTFFASKKLITLEDWEAYAWYLPYGKISPVPTQAGSAFVDPGSQSALAIGAGAATGITPTQPTLDAQPPGIPSAPAAALPTSSVTPGTLFTSVGSTVDTFSTPDQGFYNWLRSNLSRNNVVITPGTSGSGGTLQGINQETMQSLAYRYSSEVLGSAVSASPAAAPQSVPAVPPGSTSLQPGFATSAGVAQTLGGSNPLPVAQAFSALGAYNVQVFDSSFYSYMKQVFAGDPAAATLFNDANQRVRIESSQVDAIYKMYLKDRGQ